MVTSLIEDAELLRLDYIMTEPHPTTVQLFGFKYEVEVENSDDKIRCHVAALVQARAVRSKAACMLFIEEAILGDISGELPSSTKLPASIVAVIQSCRTIVNKKITVKDTHGAKTMTQAFVDNFGLFKQIDVYWKVVHGWVMCLNDGPGQLALKKQVVDRLPSKTTEMAVRESLSQLNDLKEGNLFKYNDSATQEVVKEVAAEVGLLANGVMPLMKGWGEDKWLTSVRRLFSYFVHTRKSESDGSVVNLYGEDALKVLWEHLKGKHAKGEKILQKQVDFFRAFRFLVNREVQEDIVHQTSTMMDATQQLCAPVEGEVGRKTKKVARKSSTKLCSEGASAADKKANVEKMVNDRLDALFG